MQLVFGILLLVYVPNLDPYPGYNPIRNEVVSDNTAYEPLPGGEQICPERHANLFSSKWLVCINGKTFVLIIIQNIFNYCLLANDSLNMF